MAQITHIQKAAGLFLFDQIMTVDEFVNLFNRTFDTKHDVLDFATTINEWRLAGVLSGIESNDGKPLGEQVYFPILDNFVKVLTHAFKKSIEVEQSHIRAYWAGH
jgi:hypothetical protein